MSEEIDNEIKNLLLEEEEILLSASQNRAVPGGSINTPNAIYVTNMRVIFKDPRWLGIKAEIVDISYNDVSNTRLSRGAFSTQIYLKARYHSDEIKLPAVGKDVASQVHAMIQKGIRWELPGQKVAIANTNTELSSKNDNHEENPNYMQDLERLIDWKQRSMITEEEFQNLKSLLLKKLSNKNHTVSNTQQKPPNGQQQSTNSAADNNSVASLLVYENPRLGIKMEYPFDWKKEESDDSVSFYPLGIDQNKF